MTTRYNRAVAGAIEQGLKEYAESIGETYPDQLYKDLAWEGLNHSNIIAWKNVISQTERDRVQQVIDEYTENHKNENCQ